MEVNVDMQVRVGPIFYPTCGGAHTQARACPASSRSSLVARQLSLVTVVTVLLAASAGGQTFPSPGYFRQVVFPPLDSAQLPGPQGLRDYVSEGKLRLTLTDAIRLTLLNNTDLRIDQSKVAEARYDILSAYHPFDPALISSFNALRSNSASTNQLSGAPNVSVPIATPGLSTLFQTAQFGYSQTFQTGTNYQVTSGGSKSDTSGATSTSPYYYSTLNFSFTQPLLRNRGLFPNRAPIVIARRNLEQSRLNFEAQVSDSILTAVNQYWNVVLARESLRVVRDSLQEAEATYKQDKRALELGALPPLDIYRSESQVAQRRVLAIQAEYTLKQAEEQFRQVIGADLDPYIHALDLDLAENPEPKGELFTIDAKTALDQALKGRPELGALHQALANDNTNIRLAHNSLLPDLELTGLYSSTGLINPVSSQPTVIAGGFGDALSQLVHFRYPTYGFTLSLNLPIRNRAAQAELGKASVAKRSDLYQLRKQQQAITLEVVNVVHQLEQAKLSLQAAKIARDLAEKALRAEQRKYELGAGQIFLVLEAQTELSQAEVSVVQAEVNYNISVTAVEHATGNLLKYHQVKIEQ
jgi:outer membrane protein